MRRWFLAIIVISALALGVCGALVVTRFGTHTFSGQVQNPPPSAVDFQLTDESEHSFALSDLRGRWILLMYGYISCPDVCPLTMANLKQVESQLGSQAADVRVVFVSVDPERDTPQVLQRYVHHFGADFKGLCGTTEATARAAQAFGVKYEKRATDSAIGYLVSHSAYVYLIDPQFRWRETFPFGVQPDEIAGDVKYLMSHSP